MHPSQTLTEEEVLKYALRKEEYVGVLGKEYAEKDQERRLAMDLTKLNSDVLLRYQPSSLLEQNCLSAVQVIIHSLLSGFFVQICGYV